MITKKVTITKIIVNNLKVNPNENKVTYWIGNNIERTIVFNPTISIGKNIMNYENSLILENIENTEKEIYWYNGVTNLVITGDTYGQRAWFVNLA